MTDVTMGESASVEPEDVPHEEGDTQVEEGDTQVDAAVEVSLGQPSVRGSSLPTHVVRVG